MPVPGPEDALVRVRLAPSGLNRQRRDAIPTKGNHAFNPALDAPTGHQACGHRATGAAESPRPKEGPEVARSVLCEDRDRMATVYRLTLWRRALNVLVRALLRVGLGPRHTYLLTVRGRTTSKSYSTPVTLVQDDRARWLVAPYGEVAWVRNARAAGRVRLSRGRHGQDVKIVPVPADTAGPVLKRYATDVPITRPFFDARWDAAVEQFVAEAARHPVFRIVEEAKPPAG